MYNSNMRPGAKLRWMIGGVIGYLLLVSLLGAFLPAPFASFASFETSWRSWGEIIQSNLLVYLQVMILAWALERASRNCSIGERGRGTGENLGTEAKMVSDFRGDKIDFTNLHPRLVKEMLFAGYTWCYWLLAGVGALVVGWYALQHGLIVASISEGEGLQAWQVIWGVSPHAVGELLLMVSPLFLFKRYWVWPLLGLALMAGVEVWVTPLWWAAWGF